MNTYQKWYLLTLVIEILGFYMCSGYVGKYLRPVVKSKACHRSFEYFLNVSPPKASIDTDNGVNDQDLHILALEMVDEVKSSFMSYALSTILGRALPDARDGLKPVHRRVLYAMYALNLLPDSQYRKCARVVGEVLGKFHPHGDQSVYDALVRMVQSFVMQHPLIIGHGNFGSVDDDPPAAMRYTEAKLSPIAYDTLLADIEEDCVDFISNFDGSEMEPKVLPSRLPLVLINGASGIAVGMATNIPPHNLGEVVDALTHLIDYPASTEDDIIALIPAPDFPTGGKIIGLTGSQKLYKTGSGGVVMRAKAVQEKISNSKQIKPREAIVITELPYLTNKAALLGKIAELVNDKKLDGISDIRDESDREGIRVVIELKRDASYDVVLNNLFQKTALQTTFSGNILAIVEDGMKPLRLKLKDLLKLFLDFRFKTIRNRTKNQLAKVHKRHHIVTGMLVALQRIDEIIEIIRGSTSTTISKSMLTSNRFNFSEEQCEAILSMRLGRLSSLEEKNLSTEEKELQVKIQRLSNVMSQDHLVLQIIKDELKEIKDKYAVPRRTEILSDESAIFNEEDLVPNERSVVIITDKGYIKRISYDEFNAQSRGGKGKSGMRLDHDTESVVHFFTCNNHDSLLFVTDKGIAIKIRAFRIPLSSRTTRGSPLPNVLPIQEDVKITAVIPIDSFSNDDDVILLTSQGFIKRTPIKAFETMSARGLCIISLRENDSLRWVRRCGSSDEIVVATRNGLAARLSVNDLPSTGRNSMGLQALSLHDGDEMVDMDVLTAESLESSYFLAVTERGFGKRISVEEFRVKKRRGAGVTAIKFKEKAGGSPKYRIDGDSRGRSDSLRCMRVCFPGDEIAVSTEKGAVVRQVVDEVSILSRSATGVVIQKLSGDDSVLTVDVIRGQKFVNQEGMI